MSDYDDHIVALAAFVGDDAVKAKEVAQAIRKSAPTVSQQLTAPYATRLRKETESEIGALKQQIEALKAEKEEAETAFNEFKTKTPNVAEIEAKLTEKHNRKLKELQDQLLAKDGTLKGALVDVRTEQAVARAVADHRVDPEYAREVLKPRLARRMKPNDDGKVTILQFGSDDTYDADSDDKAMDLLLQDAVKSVPPKFVLSSADRGGGAGGGGGGGTGTVTVDKIADRKAASGEYGI